MIGALTLYHREDGAFTKDHLRVLLAISAKAGLTIENALRFVNAEESATTDGLTGLPNARSLFVRLAAEVEDAQLRGSRLAVLVADVTGKTASVFLISAGAYALAWSVGFILIPFPGIKLVDMILVALHLV